jgi:hypothetical protein
MKPTAIRFGTHKDAPITSLGTPYLFWLASRSNLCKTQPELIAAVLDVLRDRLHKPGRVEAEILGDSWDLI